MIFAAALCSFTRSAPIWFNTALRQSRPFGLGVPR